METCVVIAERSRRFGSLVSAVPTGLLTLLALALTAHMVVSLLEKLNWWEHEDWSMPSFLLIGVAWPGAMICYAITRRLLVAGAPGIDRPAIIRALGFPFLLVPIGILLAWAPWIPFEYSVNTPDPVERNGRLVQLGYYAAIGLVIALWGWVVPRATLSGQLRAAAAATAGGVALVVVHSLAHVRELSELGPLGFFAPVAFACGIAWLTTFEGSR